MLKRESHFFSKKLKSSTLIEVLIGMSILMITMSLVFPLITRTEHQSGVIQRSKACMIGNSLLQKTIVTHDFSDWEFEDEQIKIIKTVEKDVLHENARIISIVISNKKGMVLFSQNYYELIEN